MIDVQVIALLLIAGSVCTKAAAAEVTNGEQQPPFGELTIPFESSKYLEIKNPSHFSANRQLKYRNQLAGDLLKIDQELQKAVPFGSSAEANLEAAKKLPARVGWLTPMKRPALKLFLSVENATESCQSSGGFKVFAKLIAAAPMWPIDAQWRHGAGSESRQNHPMGRINLVRDHYLKQHAQNCRPHYKKQFLETLDSLKANDRLSIERVQTVLADIRAQHLIRFARQRVGPELEQLNDLISTIALDSIELQIGASGLIVDRVISLLKKDGEWESVKGDRNLARKALKQYVFKPCKEFIKLFANILIPARLDAAARDSQQKEFLTSDLGFTRAMAEVRICKHLIDERAEVSKWLAETMDIKRGKSQDRD